MARRYRTEDRKDEELEEEDHERELEDEEEEFDADNSDIDEELDDEEEEFDAEDDEDDIQAEDEGEDEHKAKRARRSFLSERKRCAGLMRLEKTARKLGVKFDAAKAIANGLGLNMARARILSAAANADRLKSISPYARNVERSFGSGSKAKALTMWKQAKEKGKR